MSKVITLDEFIIRRQSDFPFASGDLSTLLRDIGLASRIVNREVNKAGLVDILGMTNTSNVHGENVTKLDVYADEQFRNALSMSGMCCGIASEECTDFISIETDDGHGDYVVCMDPLDGSSNIDVNVSIGTIFSIYRRKSKSGPVQLEDFLQPGTEQVAAGYVIYGSSTMLVYSTGNGVNGFTLDPSIGEFCLSHKDIQIPTSGNIYSVNQGNYAQFEDPVRAYIRYCESAADGKKPYTLRYIGSLVADFHRNLIKGGIYMYPSMTTAPNGKLRLLYECNPMAYLVEQAGGTATNGVDRILELDPQELHQRTPLFIGSKDMVEAVRTGMLAATNAP